jgi:hypothetical protein
MITFVPVTKRQGTVVLGLHVFGCHLNTSMCHFSEVNAAGLVCTVFTSRVTLASHSETGLFTDAGACKTIMCNTIKCCSSIQHIFSQLVSYTAYSVGILVI